MLNRLTEYLGASPRRAAMVVIILVVVLILVVAGSLFQVLNLGSYFEAPYPSEETPLSLVDNGIRWDDPLMFSEASYNLTRYYWEQFVPSPSGFTSAVFGQLANDSEQTALSSGSPATVTRTVSWAYDMSYMVNVTIFDSTGDGIPGWGDYIIFTGRPRQSDTVYTIALTYVGGLDGGFAGGEYNYAIHDGNLYSWASDTGNARPWWYY